MRIDSRARNKARVAVNHFSDLVGPRFDIDGFVAACGRRIGQRIVVYDEPDIEGCRPGPFSSAAASPLTGLALTLKDGRTIILARAGLAPLHRAHVIAHELGHVVFAHAGGRSQQLDNSEAHYLFGDLFSPAVVRSKLASAPVVRCGGTDAFEREAEAFADELLLCAANPNLRIASRYGLPLSADPTMRPGVACVG